MLPRPDLPIVLLSHCGPVSFGRHESGRTASRGAGGLVTALIGADAGPSRRRLGMRAATDEDPAVVGEHDHQVFGVTLEPEPRLLDQAEPASQERLVPTVRLRLVEVDRQGPGLLCRGPSRAAGTRAPHGDGTESPPRSTSWTCVGC
jgi:trehalose 6-phosphate synthase